MKRLFAVSAVVALVVLGALPAVSASEAVTLEGKVVCAKCSLHDEDTTGCQNVLVVGDGDAEKHYYMVKNDAYEGFGMICKGSKAVRVTGTVKEEGGHLWIAASKIATLDEKG